MVFMKLSVCSDAELPVNLALRKGPLRKNSKILSPAGFHLPWISTKPTEQGTNGRPLCQTLCPLSTLCPPDLFVTADTAPWLFIFSFNYPLSPSSAASAVSSLATAPLFPSSA